MDQIETEEQYYERLVQFIRKSLFTYELDVLEKCLTLLDMSLIEIVLKGSKVFAAQNPIVRSADLPDILNKLGIADKMSRMNEQEKIMFGQDGLLLALKFPKIIEEFFSESIDNNNALEFSKNSLQNIEIGHERVEEDLNDNKIEKYLVKRKRQVEILDKTVKEEKIKDQYLFGMTFMI